MATVTVNITGNVHDMLDGTFDTRRTKVYLRHNTEYVVDPDAGVIRLGSATVTPNDDGSFELADVIAAVDTVENLQATVYVDYADPSTRTRKTQAFGPYDLSAETGTVDIATDLEPVQHLDPSFVSETMAAMQALLDEMTEISGLTGEDDAVAYLLGNATDTRTAADARTRTVVAGDVETPGSIIQNALNATLVRVDRQVIDVRDWGAVGDGSSHPLSGYYGSLAAAQADFPMAQALTDEIDVAAALSLAYARPGQKVLVSALTDLVTNLPIDLIGRGTQWKVEGSIQNIAARNTPSAYMDQAYVFRVGNMHPAILKSGSGYTWPTVALNAISAGQRSVTVTTPGDVAAAGVTLSPGDFVMIRNNVGEVATGVGSIFDYQQFNKVVSWTPGTGVLVLEKPIKVSISSGAKLCINDGNIDTTTSVDQPWWMADEVEVECSGYLSGLAPFSGKMGAWKSQLYVARGDFQDALSSQAFVNSHIEIGASTFTGRLAEIKFAAQDSSVKIRGDYVYSADVASPATTTSIGEQSHKVDLDMTLMRGGDFPSSVLALDIWAQNITVKGRIDDYANQGQQHVVQVRSVDHATRPPADIDCSGLVVRTITGRSRYALVGTDGLLAAPKRLQMGMNVGTIDGGAVPSYLCQVGVGTEVDVAGAIGDVRRVNATGSGEVPENGSFLLAQLAGSATATATASTDTINLASHGLSNGQMIRFTSLSGGAGLSTGTDYYVVNKTTTTFQVSLTDGGSVVDITTNYTSGNLAYALAFPPGEHLYGDFTLTGPKTGDQVVPTIQAIATPSVGDVGDLTTSISRTNASLYRVRINNKSTTTVLYSVTTAPIAIYVEWTRNRN